MTVSVINDYDNSLQTVSTTGVTKTTPLATNITNNIETTANDTPVDDDRDDNLSTPDEDNTTTSVKQEDMTTMIPPSLELVKVESVKDDRDNDNVLKEDTKSSNKVVEDYPPMSTEVPLPSTSIAKTLPLVRKKSSPVASSADLKSSIVDDNNNYEVEVTFQRKGCVPQAADDVGYILGCECGTAPEDELEYTYKKKNEIKTTNNDSTIPVELSSPTPLKDRVSSIISYASSTANASLHSAFVKKTDGGVVRRDIMAASVDIVGDVAYLSFISTHLRRVDNIQALALFAVSLVGFILSSWVIIASCGRKYGTHEHHCCNVPRLSMYLILLHHIPVCFLVSVIDVGSLGGTIVGLLNICSTLLALSNSVYTTKCGELCGEGAISYEYYEKESNASTVSSVADDDNISVTTDYVLAVV